MREENLLVISERIFYCLPSPQDRTVRIFLEEFFYFSASEFHILLVPFRIKATVRASEVLAIKGLVNHLKSGPEDGESNDALGPQPWEENARYSAGNDQDLEIVHYGEMPLVTKLPGCSATGTENFF